MKPAGPSAKGTLPLVSAVRAAVVATVTLLAMATTPRWAAALAAGIWPPWEKKNPTTITFLPTRVPSCVFTVCLPSGEIWLHHLSPPPCFSISFLTFYISSHLAPDFIPFAFNFTFYVSDFINSQWTSFISNRLWFHPIKSGFHLSVILNLILFHKTLYICVCSHVQWLVSVCVCDCMCIYGIFSSSSVSYFTMLFCLSVSIIWIRRFVSLTPLARCVCLSVRVWPTIYQIP